MLLRVVKSCCVKIETNSSQHSFCSAITEAYGNNVGSVCTALPTLVGPHRHIKHGLLEHQSRVSQYCRSILLHLSLLWQNALQVRTMLGVISYFRFPKPLTFKTRLSAKPWHRTCPRFETEALANSKMVYCIRLHTTVNTILQRPTF